MTTSTPRDLSLRTVGRSALILTGSTLVVQVLAIARELFVAAKAGISGDLDALLIALVLPITLSGVLTTGTVTALVPAYADARAGRGAAAARRFSGLVLVWVGLAGLALTLALELLAEVAVAITGPGLSSAGQANAVMYLRLLAPLAFIAAISGILSAVCQAEERFAGIAASAVAGAIATLVVIVLAWDQLGLGAVAVANLVGPLLTAGVLVVASARAAALPRPTVRPSGPELGAFVRHAIPLTLSGAILQVNVIADRAVASLLGPGAVSALRFGEVLVRTPIAAIGPAWGTALYPALVRTARSDDEAGLGEATSRSIRYALSLFVPLAALTAAVAPVAVAVAYQRGAFGPADVERTAHVVAGFAPLIVILMVSPVLTGALNARQRGRVLLVGGTLSVIVNVALDFVLGFWLGAAGVALATSITSTIVLVFFARRVASSERGFALRPLARCLVIALEASIVPGLVAAAAAWLGLVPSGLLPGVAFLVVAGTLGMALYLATAARLGLAEVRTMTDIGLGWIADRTRAGIRRS